MSMLNSVSKDVAKAMSVNKRVGINAGSFHVVETVSIYEQFELAIIETDEKPNRHSKLLATSIEMGQAVYSLGEYNYIWAAREALSLAKELV